MLRPEANPQEEKDITIFVKFLMGSRLHTALVGQIALPINQDVLISRLRLPIFGVVQFHKGLFWSLGHMYIHCTPCVSANQL